MHMLLVLFVPRYIIADNTGNASSCRAETAAVRTVAKLFCHTAGHSDIINAGVIDLAAGNNNIRDTAAHLSSFIDLTAYTGSLQLLFRIFQPRPARRASSDR